MNPATGTFTTMDTYAGSIFDPTSLHKYLYANANPVTYVDPSGYFGLTDVVCANAIGDMLFYGISAGIINVGLNLIREIRAANKYGTKVDFAYVITMSFIEGFLVGSFFGGCSILASSLNSAIIQTALGGTSFLFGSISLAQSQNDLENHDYDLMVLDIIFATGGFVAAERCFDSAAEISSAKNTAETVTVPTPENTNTAKEISKAELVRQNNANGEKAELAQYELELKEYPNTKRQVSIRAYDGNGNLSMKRTRADLFNEKGIIEVKASKNAPLTNNQKALYPLIAKYGGRVVGIKYGSYDIPPQDVYITRDGVTVLLFSKGG